MYTEVDIDKSSLDNLNKKFDSLSGKDLEKIERKALTKAKNLIVKQTKANLKTHTRRYRSRYSNLKNRWHLVYKNGVAVSAKRLDQGIQAKWHKDTDEYKINIMQDFRLKFFEKGTADRFYTSKHGKSHYTGHNVAWYFFRNAISSTREQSQQIIDDTISTQLHQIWDSENK